MEIIDLSIIIVSWNAREYLVECIDSILEQYFPIKYEILVVDNASRDGSAEVVRQKYSKVRLIQNEQNDGFAKANNIGINKSTGNYICFINSDVKVLAGCILKLFEFLEENSRVGLAGPKILGRDGKTQRSCMGFPTLWNLFCRSMALDRIFPRSKFFSSQMMAYWAHDSIREVDVINGCFWIVRRDAIHQVGPLDETFFIYAEDIDWCRRFHEAGWRVLFYPLAEAIHYGGGSSINAPMHFHIEMQKANFQYWKKYHNKISQKAYLALRVLHEVVRLIGHAIAAILMPKRKEISIQKIKRSWVGILWALRSIIQSILDTKPVFVIGDK